jgi:hypothetical protein
MTVSAILETWAELMPSRYWFPGQKIKSIPEVMKAESFFTIPNDGYVCSDETDK